LYQGVYKAVLIKSDEQFVYLSKYIHSQSLASQGEALRGSQDQPSSYPEYLGLRKTEWVHPEKILTHFTNLLVKSSTNLSYKSFVENLDEFKYKEFDYFNLDY